MRCMRENIKQLLGFINSKMSIAISICLCFKYNYMQNYFTTYSNNFSFGARKKRERGNVKRQLGFIDYKMPFAISIILGFKDNSRQNYLTTYFNIFFGPVNTPCQKIEPLM